jgi:hypothetical protein
MISWFKINAGTVLFNGEDHKRAVYRASVYGRVKAEHGLY